MAAFGQLPQQDTNSPQPKKFSSRGNFLQANNEKYLVTRYVISYLLAMEHEDFITNQGLAFFAHRLRRASELLTSATGEWLSEQGFVTPPRAVSTVQLLHRDGPLAITTISGILRFSHPLILKLVEQLAALGLVTAAQDEKDRRRRMVQLTPAGHAEAQRLATTNQILAASYAELFEAFGTDGLELMTAVEADCKSGTFATRLRLNMAKLENLE